MSDIKNDIIKLLEHNPGLSDRELADAIKGHGRSPQYINQKCRALASGEIILRKKRKDGLFGNWLIDDDDLSQSFGASKTEAVADDISEKKMKQILETFLSSIEWEPDIAWGRNHAIDIEARHGADRWIIEVKGSGSYNPVRAGYFLSVLGEVLQRMDDPHCKYSIALPDMEQFRRLWERLPSLAKNRTGITALFVNPAGHVTEKTR